MSDRAAQGAESAATAERRAAVLAALASAETGVSGEQLAQRLGCSRAAIHRHVAALRRSGIAIDGHPDGYRLARGADPVVPALITPQLTPPIGGPVEWLVSTGSTNDDLIARARDGAPEGLVIGADHQQAGRGRRGRAFVADPGDALLVSALLRPPVAPVEAGLLPIVVAVAVAEALGGEARIIWPNDILIGGRKVVGVLCEMSADQERVAWAVVGVGINVRGAPTLVDARWRPGSLAESGDDRSRSEVLVALLDTLARNYRRWLDEGPAAILAAFAERDGLRGRAVSVAVGSGRLEGTCTGLDEFGRLRLAGPEGERALAAGEVVRVEGIPAD